MQIEECLRSTILRLGGSFGGVAFLKEWNDYFPYFPSEQLRANVHRKLHARQGRRRTYLVGEAFNLPLVSEVRAHVTRTHAMQAGRHAGRRAGR